MSSHRLDFLIKKLQNTHSINSKNRKIYATHLIENEVRELIKFLGRNQEWKKKTEANRKKYLEKLTSIKKNLNIVSMKTPSRKKKTLSRKTYTIKKYNSNNNNSNQNIAMNYLNKNGSVRVRASKTNNSLKYKNNLKVLTWNIDYSQDDTFSRMIQEKTISHFLLKKVDLMAFQEMTKTNHFNKFNAINKLIEYNYYHIHTIIGTKTKTEMHTFIHRSIPLLTYYEGQYEPGRPFCMVLLQIRNEILLFINCHVGHKRSRQNNNANGVRTSLKRDDVRKMQEVIDNNGIRFDRVILVGDMNRNLDFIDLSGARAQNIIPASIRNSNFTCCNDFRKQISRSNYYTWSDHILDSKYIRSINNRFNYYLPWSPQDIVNPYRNMGSDHCPVYGTLPI